MVIAAPEPVAILEPIVEKRSVVRGLSWDAYLQLMDELPQSRGSRLTYDNGILEMTVPLEKHEFSGRLIERFITALIELMNLRMKTMGSTTMKYPKLKKGAEPDNAYYIQNQPLTSKRMLFIQAVISLRDRWRSIGIRELILQKSKPDIQR